MENESFDLHSLIVKMHNCTSFSCFDYIRICVGGLNKAKQQFLFAFWAALGGRRLNIAQRLFIAIEEQKLLGKCWLTIFACFIDTNFPMIKSGPNQMNIKSIY